MVIHRASAEIAYVLEAIRRLVEIRVKARVRKIHFGRDYAL